jgi:hypothetical protein
VEDTAIQVVRADHSGVVDRKCSASPDHLLALSTINTATCRHAHYVIYANGGWDESYASRISLEIVFKPSDTVIRDIG